MKIQFDTENSAFEEEYKLAGIRWVLRDIMTQVSRGLPGGKVKDINGNTIGKWEL